MLKTATVLAAFALCAPSIGAQWEKRTNPNVPRLANGNVNLDARRRKPRRPSGSLGAVGRAPGDGRGRGRAGAAGANATPPPPRLHRRGHAAHRDVRQPGHEHAGRAAADAWADALLKQRDGLKSKDNPDANCMPMGFTQFHQQPQPREIIQLKDKILIIYEANYGLRQIYTDGRALPSRAIPRRSGTATRLAAGGRHPRRRVQQPARRRGRAIRRLARRSR